MLKIYLDWNIISYLKKEEYIDLRNYIAEVKDFFVFPYSRAQFPRIQIFPPNIMLFFRFCIHIYNLQLLLFGEKLIKPSFYTRFRISARACCFKMAPLFVFCSFCFTCFVSPIARKRFKPCVIIKPTIGKC